MAIAAIKRYGPVQGAGTTLTEKLTQQQIQASPLGNVAYAGLLEKGVVGELIECTGKSKMLRKAGGRIDDGLCPDANEDFWDESLGAGRQYLVRVTDGTERKASWTLKTRESDSVTGSSGAWRNCMQIDALSGGRWAGKRKRVINEITGSGDLTETTIDTGLTMLVDEYAGGTLTMTGIAGETFEVLGNTIAGIVTLRADAQLLTKFGAAVDFEYVLELTNTDDLGNDKRLEVVIKDGVRDPVNEFGMEIYWDGAIVLDYINLSMDPNSDVYFVSVINEDTSNEEIRVTDLFTPNTPGSFARPANKFGKILSGALAALVLTLEWYQTSVDAGNTGDGVVGALDAASSPKLQEDFITLTCADITTPGSELWDVTSQAQGVTFAQAVTAVAYTPPNEYFPAFTIAVGATPFVVGDKLYITVSPVIPSEAIGGRLYYDTASPRAWLEIVDATVVSVSVRAGNVLTDLTAEDNYYRLEYGQSLSGGYNGHAGVTDNDYIAAFDVATSQFNKLKDRQLGLVKFAVPGVESSAVQIAARAYAEANNHMFRVEIPKTVTTEDGAIEWMEGTMGRNDFQQMIFPSWAYKTDPDRTGLKLVPLSGMVMGEEARIARVYKGYHKAGAGEEAVLGKIVKLNLATDYIPVDETLNPKGIQCIQKKKGNWVVWGDRIPATSTGLTWKHQRELLSHYERTMMENYDWVIFAINDTDLWIPLLNSFNAYFMPEWRPKRAIRGDTFKEAAQFKVDSENNNDATLAAGDLYAAISLRLADTVERLNIIISPAGIFEILS